MKAKWYTWVGLICAVLLLLLSLVIHFKTPTYARAITEHYGGRFAPDDSKESDWQKFIERCIGECPRFEKPWQISIQGDELTDSEVDSLGPSDTLEEICLRGNQLTNKTLDSLANHKGLYFVGVASNQLTDDAFSAAARIATLKGLRLMSDSITGDKISDLSATRITELIITSENLNHLLISQASFPKDLDLLLLVGPPMELEDYVHYNANLPGGCKLIVSPPLPDLSSVQNLRHRIDLRASKSTPAEIGACD